VCYCQNAVGWVADSPSHTLTLQNIYMVCIYTYCVNTPSLNSALGCDDAMHHQLLVVYHTGILPPAELSYVKRRPDARPTAAVVNALAVTPR